MTTAAALIQDALEELRIYAPGETASQADFARGFDLLNNMIDELAAQSIYLYDLTSLSFDVLAAISKYTIGPAGRVMIAAPRPDRITYGPAAASFVIPANPPAAPNAITSPVNVVSAIEFQSLQGYYPIQDVPDTLYYQAAYPYGVLNILPVPNVFGTLSFTAWQRLAGFAQPSTDANLAVGVEDMIRNNLAVYLKPYFADSQLNPAVIVLAKEAKDFLRYQSLNSRAMMNRFTVSSAPRKPE